VWTSGPYLPIDHRSFFRKELSISSNIFNIGVNFILLKILEFIENIFKSRKEYLVRKIIIFLFMELKPIILLVILF
jgi:hypothetical protein